MNISSHLTGLSVAARDAVTCSAAGAIPSSAPTASVGSQPRIHSLDVNVDLHLSSHPSGACWLLVLFVKCTVLQYNTIKALISRAVVDYLVKSEAWATAWRTKGAIRCKVSEV